MASDDDGDQDIMDPVTDAEQEHYDDMNQKLDEATDDQDEAICSECGESHDDGACWDDEEDHAEDTESDRTDYEPGQKRPLDHGVKVRAKVKRGTGTRDQDELLIEGRGQDADEAAADFEAALQEAESRNWTDRLRDLQAGDEEVDDGN